MVALKSCEFSYDSMIEQKLFRIQDGPEDILSRKALILTDGVFVFEMHGAPPRFVVCEATDTGPALRSRCEFPLHLTSGATTG